jgi:hypothetical protein
MSLAPPCSIKVFQEVSGSWFSSNIAHKVWERWITSFANSLTAALRDRGTTFGCTTSALFNNGWI